jgi:hypothetical protein
LALALRTAAINHSFAHHALPPLIICNTFLFNISNPALTVSKLLPLSDRYTATCVIAHSTSFALCFRPHACRSSSGNCLQPRNSAAYSLCDFFRFSLEEAQRLIRGLKNLNDRIGQPH